MKMKPGSNEIQIEGNPSEAELNRSKFEVAQNPCLNKRRVAGQALINPTHLVKVEVQMAERQKN